MSARGEPDCELTDEPGTPARAPARPPTARAASQPPPHRLFVTEPAAARARAQPEPETAAPPGVSLDSRQQSVTASITRQPGKITVGLQYVATRSHAKQNKPLADRDAKSARLHTRLANLAHSCQRIPLRPLGVAPPAHASPRSPCTPLGAQDAVAERFHLRSRREPQRCTAPPRGPPVTEKGG